MILLQNPSIPTATNQIDIDSVIADLNTKLLANIPWLSHAYGRGYRLLDATQGGQEFKPEVYLGEQSNSWRYTNITPDNDKTGQCFFYVVRENYSEGQSGQYGLLTYDVAVIFSVNMALADKPLLSTEIYQQNLVSDVRSYLMRENLGNPYNLRFVSTEYEFQNVFSGFNIKDQQRVEKAPFTHFRVNLQLQIWESCSLPPVPANLYSFVFDGTNEYIQAPVATELDFDYNEAFSISIWVKNVSSSAFLIGKSNVAVTKAYFVRLVGNLVAFSFTNSPQGFSIRTVASLDTSVWNHIVVTNALGGGTANMKIYLNGVLQPTTIVALPAITSSIKNTSSLFLGGLSVSNLGSFTCANARVWNIKLDAADVLEEYNSGIVNPTPTQGANCVYNPDFNNAVWDGVKWDIPDLTAITSGYTSVNMEEADRITDVPS